MAAEKKTQSEQRAAMLDAALAQIDKQFGKGSAMRLGDQERVKMQAIPTSSLALDIALGIGGLPKGRIIEIYGPESSGKCLVADTLVPTNWGLLTIEEIFEQCGQKASCTSRVTDISYLGLEVLNEYGKMESVQALTHNNKKPVLKIQTSAGREIKVTHNHPVRVMNERGTVVWRLAEKLAVGDTLLGVTGGFENAKDRITEDEAIIAGYLIGDGHMKNDNSTMFSQLDVETANEFKTIFSSLYPEAKFVTYEHRPNDIWVRSKVIKTHLVEVVGIGTHGSPQKEVPWTVRSSSLTIQKAFLSALYECDGGVEKGTVCLSTSSEKLAQQVQAMLSTFGLSATRLPKKVAAYPDNTYWTISLPREDSVKFIDLIGFRSQRRAEQSKAITAVKTREAQTRNIPHQVNIIRDLGEALGGNREFYKIADDLFRTLDNGKPFVSLSPQRTQKIIRWAEDNGGANHPLTEHLRSLLERNSSYETIVSITDGGEQPTFDLVVPGTQSFVANGLAVHNTTLALHAIANVQKEGGNVAFIDAEHALDPEYAEALGIDLDNLIVSQPDTGEQALDITDLLIRSGAIDLIVVDSVAALVPRAEIEGDMGQSHVGLQARLMSQALRKITGGLNTTGTTAIFINQLREKIGVMFGCFSEDTPVRLADGSSEKIGVIVDNRMPVEVLSYNANTGMIEPARVTDWFDNGVAEKFLEFTVVKPYGVGEEQFVSFKVTPNHMLSTPDGWESAEDVAIGSDVLIMDEERKTVVPAEVLNIDVITGSSSMRKFDLEIKGNHNYFVGSDATIMVHNSPETTTGGKALKFYASVRLDIRRIETLKLDGAAVANRTRVKVVKNKVAPPFKQAEFDIIFGEGISREGGIIDLGVEHGFIRKAGAWYTYEGDQLGQGKEKVRQFLKDNPALADEIENLILEKVGIRETDVVEEIVVVEKEE